VQGVEHPAGDRRGRLGVGDPLQQHGELVPAKAGGHVGGAQAALEPPGRGHQKLVAGRVAEAVVDVLEVVQVDEQHGHVALAGAGQGVLDPLGEQGPVARPVSPSWKAWWTSWASSSLRSETSRVLSTRPRTLASSSRLAATVSECSQVPSRWRTRQVSAGVTPGRRAASATNLATRSRSSDGPG